MLLEGVGVDGVFYFYVLNLALQGMAMGPPLTAHHALTIEPTSL